MSNFICNYSIHNILLFSFNTIAVIFIMDFKFKKEDFSLKQLTEKINKQSFLDYIIWSQNWHIIGSIYLIIFINQFLLKKSIILMVLELFNIYICQDI